MEKEDGRQLLQGQQIALQIYFFLCFVKFSGTAESVHKILPNVVELHFRILLNIM